MKRSRVGSSTASVPVPAEFDIRHMPDPSIPPLVNKLMSPSLSHHGKQQLTIEGKLYSWNQGLIQIKSADHKAPCAKAIACGDQVVLQNVDSSTNKETTPPIAICRRKFTFVGKIFKVYTTLPFHVDQQKSKSFDYNGIAMYTFASVERAPFSSTLHVRFANTNNNQSSDIAYVIDRVGSQKPKKRTIRNNQNGNLAAFIEDKTDSTVLNINDGIDPYLMVCLAVICEELDHQ